MPADPAADLDLIARAEAAVLARAASTPSAPDGPLALGLRTRLTAALLDDPDLARDLAALDARRSAAAAQAIDACRPAPDAVPAVQASARSEALTALAQAQGESARALLAVLHLRGRTLLPLTPPR